ncbi:beta-1,3-glucan-binding protein-like [Leguminivora glycinivorella]|uniref:beta-1,3-glucan-binding protein-like n=1 Tax=Leguminivora glycinivorella TaxID=1035111 RepID=UPI00200D2711|nr:beta-1,3-glucan-binding protein-like [Leguminivora glycinivorella]
MSHESLTCTISDIVDSMDWLCFLIFLFSRVVVGENVYKLPKAKVEAIYPKGLRVSIPDDGYTMFSFHGTFNTKMNGFEAGQWNRDHVRPKNGLEKWTFRDKNVKLKIGNVIYYWISVEKNGLLYKSEEEIPYVEYAEFLEPYPAPPPPPTGFPCPVSSTLISAPGFVCRGQLLFEDSFNALVTRRWKPENVFPGGPDFPFNMYSDEAVTYQNGNLVISAVHDHPGIHAQEITFGQKCTGKIGTNKCTRKAADGNLPRVMTGKITTKEKFSFKFGRAEVRAKMPVGDWLIPEINLEPFENAYGKHNYNSGLIKLAFVKGNLQFAKQLYGGAILKSSEPFRSKLLKEKLGAENWSHDFHNYTLVWKPDGLDLYVDSEQYGSIPADWITREDIVPVERSWLDGSLMAPLDKLFYLSIGLRVGGVNDFENSSTKPWKNRSKKPEGDFWKAKGSWIPTWTSPELKVDYIRVFAL